MNDLVSRKTIMEAWTFLREHSSGIPEETLDFMKEAALEKLNDLEKSESTYNRLMRGRNEN
jgi:hypothetical protein